MRNYILTTLFLAAILTAGCGKDDTSGLVAQQENNLRIAGRVFETFNRHDWAGMSDLYSDPAEFKDPSFGQEIVRQTRKQIAEKYGKYAEMSPDIRDSVIATYSAGERNVIVEFVSSGTGPDGLLWTLPICTIFTIENGKITRDYTYYDTP